MTKFDESTLEIESIWASRYNPHDFDPKWRNGEVQVLGIDWSCNLGFGRYELLFEDDGTRIEAYSESMDSNENKTFLRALLEKVADMAEVVE